MEEKLLILKMLEEGKITSDEAMKLLESLDKDNSNIKYEKNTSDKFNQTINEFSKKAEKLAEKFGPDFISRVENVSSDFADAAVKFADKMVNYLSSGISNIDGYNSLTKNYSIPITNDNIKINLKTQNIVISVNSSNTQEVAIRLILNLYKDTINIDSYINLETSGEVISFATDFPSKVWGKLEITIPKNIEELIIETTNSKCQFTSVKAEELKCITSNAKIEVDGCNFEKLFTKTNNAKIQIDNTFASNAIIDTSNANIEIEDSSFDNLKSFTSNNGIHLANFSSIKSGEANYNLQTSNGKIKIGLSKNNDLAYKINAKTSLGNINLSQLESSYYIEKNDGNMQAEATVTSNNYNSIDKKILIDAVTTNSSINITKN